MKQRVHFAPDYFINPTHPISVCLVGCGGTGSMVLTSLARINHALCALGHPGIVVTAFDHDIVTESNIGRQLFSPSDEGRYKAEVLISRINQFFGLDWEAKLHKYSTGGYNIVISCTDNIASRYDIYNYAKSNTHDMSYATYIRSCYWMDFGNTTDKGQVVLGTFDKVKQPESKLYKPVGKLKTVVELFDYSSLRDEDSGPSCSLAEALDKQDLFINSTLSQLGSALLWQLLRNGMTDIQGMFLNLNTMRVNPISI